MAQTCEKARWRRAREGPSSEADLARGGVQASRSGWPRGHQGRDRVVCAFRLVG
jgi:hypothetical protein